MRVLLSWMSPAGDECTSWGTQLQIDGALSRWRIAALNNAMFIKHFKPWVEVIRARLFTTIVKTSSFEHRHLYLQNVSLKACVNVGLSMSHGVDTNRVPCV